MRDEIEIGAAELRDLFCFVEPYLAFLEGELRAFTIVHRASPGVTVPYISGIVDLDGGGVVKANIIGIDPEPGNLTLGMKVSLTTFPIGTDAAGTEAVAFGYKPA